MATGFNPLGSSAYSNAPKIAMVQPAIPVKDWRYYEKTIIAMEEGTGKMWKEYKDSRAWKEQYKTWDEACEPLGKSRRHVDRLILKDVDSHANFLAKTTNRTECPNTAPQEKKESLTILSRLPVKFDDGETEKPHIRTADEIKSEQKPQARKATENGKPKNQLALWKEIEESVYGRGLRLVDDLNRQCPNAQLHGELISWTKVCLQTLDKWRKSVK